MAIHYVAQRAFHFVSYGSAQATAIGDALVYAKLPLGMQKSSLTFTTSGLE